MNRELLRLRSYLFLLSAQTVSNLGDWLSILALLALVGLKWQGSPLAVSGAMLCFAVPSILVGSLAGTVADRMDRKTLMIVADILRALTIVGVAFSTQLWEVYVLLCIKSTFSAFFEPAKEGKLKEIVPNELMQPAVSMSELINNGAKIIGPILSGVLVAGVGIQWSFYLDSLSFVLSAVLLFGVPRTKRRVLEKDPVSAKKTSGFFSQLTEGFTFIKNSRPFLAGIVVFCLAILLLQISDTQFIILLRLIPGMPINLLGYAMAATGVGVIVSALILGKKEIRSFLKVLSLSCFALGAIIILIPLTIHMPIQWLFVSFPFLGVCLGISAGMTMIPFNVMVQKETPEAMTGRVFGTINSMASLAAMIGMATGGILSELLGVVNTFLIGGAVLAAVGLFVYIGRNRIEGGRTNAKGQSGTPREAQS